MADNEGVYRVLKLLHMIKMEALIPGANNSC